MNTVLTYFISLIVIMILVFVTLFFKNELERMFREKRDVFAFHICNVMITLIVSLAAHAVMTIYITGNEFKLLPQLVIFMFIILPIYILGHLAFKKYNSIYQKYTITENEKVVVLNEKYLKKKKLPAILTDYNAAAKETKLKKYKNWL